MPHAGQSQRGRFEACLVDGGKCLLSDTGEYEARLKGTAGWLKSPEIIVQPSSSVEVARILQEASDPRRETRMQVSVGGGCHTANCAADGAVMIDLVCMCNVTMRGDLIVAQVRSSASCLSHARVDQRVSVVLQRHLKFFVLVKPQH